MSARQQRTLKPAADTPTPINAPIYPGVLEELVRSAWHHVEQYANNSIEADHGQLERRLRPMRGLQTDRTAQVVIAGHAFVQNLRRGHYELGVDARPALRVAAAFTELAQAL
jgi:transposase-like protein